MANARPALIITETDEVDTPLVTYLYSETATATTPSGRREDLVKRRIDVVPPASSSATTAQIISPSSTSTLNSIFTYLLNIFLPAGYPHSVSKDYLEYQIYDSVQAFSSSIAGLLSSRAVLQGIGVGDAAASPTSALLLHILQDSSGRIATILFAHRLGTALEPECKMYRLAADVFNDVAMVLDCLSPLVGYRPARVAILSGAGVLRALCGVSGGSSKASLSAHFAKWGNIGELNAKDSSQETVISLLGMLAGSAVVSHVTSVTATWILLIFLLSLHLATNYRAVRAVQMTSLNRQRANIVFSTMLSSDLGLANLAEENIEPNDRTGDITSAKAPRPNEVADQERVFERDGVLRWAASEKIGWCRIGVSIEELFALLKDPSSQSASINQDSSALLLFRRLVELFASEFHLLYLSATQKDPQVAIVLKQGCTPALQLKAWAHALLLAKTLTLTLSEGSANDKNAYIMDAISHTLDVLNENSRFEQYVSKLVGVGWDLDIAALETRPGRRIKIGSSDGSFQTSPSD